LTLSTDAESVRETNFPSSFWYAACNGLGCNWLGLEVTISLSRENSRKERNLFYSLFTQVLQPIVFPYFNSLSEEEKQDFIFMEDGAKVHKGKARLPKLEVGIWGFDWPPSSPDLNPIEKVWR
jgi:DDE superfamily endonuclease